MNNPKNLLSYVPLQKKAKPAQKLKDIQMYLTWKFNNIQMYPFG